MNRALLTGVEEIGHKNHKLFIKSSHVFGLDILFEKYGFVSQMFESHK